MRRTLWLIVKLINVNDLMMSPTPRNGRNGGAFNCYGHLAIHDFEALAAVVVFVDVNV